MGGWDVGCLGLFTLSAAEHKLDHYIIWSWASSAVDWGRFVVVRSSDRRTSDSH